jgi:hypothetical protein
MDNVTGDAAETKRLRAVAAIREVWEARQALERQEVLIERYETRRLRAAHAGRKHHARLYRNSADAARRAAKIHRAYLKRRALEDQIGARRLRAAVRLAELSN